MRRSGCSRGAGSQRGSVGGGPRRPLREWLGVQAADNVGRLAQQRAGRSRRGAARTDGRRARRRDRLARRSRWWTDDVPRPRGRGSICGPSSSTPGWLEGCDWLHVSGYALFVEPVRSAALRGVELGRELGARVSVDLASWSGIRDAGADEFRALLERIAPDVVFSNEEEARALGQLPVGPAILDREAWRGRLLVRR